MLRRVAIFTVAAALGGGAAAGVAACGEDREGEVQFEDGGTGTEGGGTETTGTTGTETTGTAETESDGGTTAPETETSP
jgi:hypothetical protein